MQSFNAKHPAESVVLTFNYVLFLPSGVLLSGLPQVTITNSSGGDPNPNAMFNGTAAVDPTGLLVLQPVTGGIDGNTYIVTATCLTTNGYWVPALPAILPVSVNA